MCCIRCNLKKGPNIASMDPETNRVVTLFHPRHHAWRDHFTMSQDGMLHGLTPEGRATVELLDMNETERVHLRAALVRRGWRP